MTDLAPLHRLRLLTPRLELRLGTHEELVELGQLAERGVHPPEEMPFSVAWTDRIGESDFLEGFVEYHEGHVREWSPDAWELHFLVWEQGELVGTQAIFAKRFAETRHVGTGSWLGREFQGCGIGTEMRAAVLEFAFRGLGAEETESDWLAGNEASRTVSEKLGYTEAAVGSVSPRGVPVPAHDVRITRDAWVCPIPVAFEGLEPCLPLFGARPTPPA